MSPHNKQQTNFQHKKTLEEEEQVQGDTKEGIWEYTVMRKSSRGLQSYFQ